MVAMEVRVPSGTRRTVPAAAVVAVEIMAARIRQPLAVCMAAAVAAQQRTMETPVAAALKVLSLSPTRR